MTRVAVYGAAGRMGRTVIETAASRENLRIVCGIDATAPGLSVPSYAAENLDAALREHQPDAVIDFSVPDASVSLAETCANFGVALVIGTTGFSKRQLASLETASEAVPLLKATNFSRGIQALLRALGSAVESLDGYDIEVVETHHNQKQDAPSGTANTILETLAEYREFETVSGREGIQPREENEIGMLVRRAGGIRGEHEVLLAGNDEVLTLTHRAEDRAVFAAGALDSAVWVAERDAGWYEFGDVVGSADD